jgi:cytochrome P450
MSLLAPETTSLPDLSDQATYVPGLPLETFAEIRRRPGLYWQPTPISTRHGGFWAVTRFADIVAIEKDPGLFTSTEGVAYPSMFPGENNPFRDNLMFTDPPRHSTLRRAAAAGFAPRIVANFEPWVREIVREAIAAVDGVDEFDYVDAFAKPIPAYVIATVLGAPASDRQKLVDFAFALFAAGQQTDGLEEGQAAIDSEGTMQAMMDMAAYASRIQEIKRSEPADDMFTALGALVDSGDLSQGEFIHWMILMMGAGFETTHTAIGQSMRLYLEDPETREAMDRAMQEGMTDRAVDEFIRLSSPPMQMARVATRDTEIAGTQIRKDDVVVMYFASANRDEAVFSNPDRFDPWRPEKETLAFGSGAHRCIGSYLAKLEVRVLWEELAASGLHLRLNGEPKRGWSNFINQLSELPVARV